MPQGIRLVFDEITLGKDESLYTDTHKTKTRNSPMNQYLEIIKQILTEGYYKENRTDADTIKTPPISYNLSLGSGYPLLTTKDMSDPLWDSMLHELFWYLSGEEHIRTLREHTSIWDAWADENGNLESAYGRFWRRYPVPENPSQLPGEAWADRDDEYVTVETNEEGDESLVFDQLRYAINGLKENPNSRRYVISAWHPANASVSKLPPCHWGFTLNTMGDTLVLSLEQRSADVAVGVPFNLACYSLVAKMMAQETGFEKCIFSHRMAEPHIYCGKGDRGKWYAEHMDDLREKAQMAANPDSQATWGDMRQWIHTNAWDEPDSEEGHDHIPMLLKQLQRDPYDRPEVHIADKSFFELGPEDITLKDYKHHDRLRFSVAQ